MANTDVTAAAEIIEAEGEAAAALGGREALWYPVGVALALLVASGGLIFCFSGQWIG